MSRSDARVTVQPRASLIITTRNRAEHLRQTLESLAGMDVPGDLPCELIVVDNGSTDATRDVVLGSPITNLAVTYLTEAQPGQSNARNKGIVAARGEVIVFTDDDVRVSATWLADICRPILAGQADAIAGAVKLAPHLDRPWMDQCHRTTLASTDRFARGEPLELVGANMAFTAKVLKVVPRFDPELGPGALGFSDDSLFALQLIEAGFRLQYLPTAIVEHHFDESRLLRTSFLDTAVRQGRTWAYRGYHWEHLEEKNVRSRLLKARLRLALWSLKYRRQTRRQIGCEPWEMTLRQDIHYLNQWIKESKRPRIYARRGLTRLLGAPT